MYLFTPLQKKKKKKSSPHFMIVFWSYFYQEAQGAINDLNGNISLPWLVFFFLYSFIYYF